MQKTIHERCGYCRILYRFRTILQFGRQIKAVITETLEGLGVIDAHVQAIDKGALDCTIRARVTAAAVRATGKDVWKD